MKTTQMSISWWTDKQNIAYSYDRTLLNHKEDWNNYICYHMNGPQKHANWKKADTKGQMLWDSIYVVYLDS